MLGSAILRAPLVAGRGGGARAYLMKENLAEQLNWLENEYSTDKDPLVILAKDNLERLCENPIADHEFVGKRVCPLRALRKRVLVLLNPGFGIGQSLSVVEKWALQLRLQRQHHSW